MSFIYAQFCSRKSARKAANENHLDVGTPVPGMMGISVDETGCVFKNGKRLKGEIHTKGYRRVCLRSGGVDKNHYVHALVALAFLGPRPVGYHVDHIDFDKLNNRPSNLRYLTALENSTRRRMRK